MKHISFQQRQRKETRRIRKIYQSVSFLLLYQPFYFESTMKHSVYFCSSTEKIESFTCLLEIHFTLLRFFVEGKKGDFCASREKSLPLLARLDTLNIL